MNIEQQLEKLLSLAGENEVVEFKTAKNDYTFSKLGKYFSALSNEANLKNMRYAWLVFGVDNKHNVVGTNYRNHRPVLDKLKEEVADKTTNRITFIDIHEIQHKQGRVLLFQIPAAPQGIPITFNGHYYGRDGEALSPLNMEEFERIRNQNKWSDWSSGICEGASINDLSAEAISRAREVFVVKNPKFKQDILGWDDATFLNKAKLTINGKFTRTAILLLGSEESEYFLTPANARISWILKDRDGLEKDYQHFTCPLLLAVDQVFNKIRNLKYRYISDGTLFPEEVDQYEPYIIREALNNCIAHQDYLFAGKISVVEFEDGRLCFSNMGSFIPETIDRVIKSDAPESRYRNTYLANAMVNLNMIDTVGSGIRKMFLLQKKKFFPLPEYDLSNNQVKVTITGKVLDIHYANHLAQTPDLNLDEIIALDRVQKRLPITEVQAKHLRKLKLIEGRKPNFYISEHVARHTGQGAEYIRNKGLDDTFYKKIICDYLAKFGEARRADINLLLLDKLPDVLSDNQKTHKTKNLLQSLKKQGVISVLGKVWSMSKDE